MKIVVTDANVFISSGSVEINQIMKDQKNGKNISNSDIIKRVGISGFFGFLGSRLPDLLEPAKNHNHRSFFHSVLFLFSLIAGLALLFRSKKGNILFSSLKSAGVGYTSHLAMDSTTPKGLPLLLK